MADYRGIHAATEAVVELLRSSYRQDDFNNTLEFRVFTSRDFATPITNGVSLVLYRIVPHGSSRTPAGALGGDGRRLQSRLPLVLHFLLTVWAQRPSLQHSIAGWMMRTLEDNALLPTGLLNAAAPGTFGRNETLEIAVAELATEDLMRVWEALDTSVYQLSIPYLARVLSIDSQEPVYATGEGDVRERRQRVGVLEGV